MDILLQSRELARTVPIGHLIRADDEDVEHVYAISSAEYATYQDGSLWWLTLTVRAEQKLAPDDDLNPEPWLEINIPFHERPSSLLRPAQTLAVVGYSDRFSNMASMYYWSHQSFDGELVIESGDESGFTAVICGQVDSEPVCLRAVFRPNPEVRRSFV